MAETSSLRCPYYQARRVPRRISSDQTPVVVLPIARGWVPGMNSTCDSRLFSRQAVLLPDGYGNRTVVNSAPWLQRRSTMFE
jgi:hypothetical protein